MTVHCQMANIANPTQRRTHAFQGAVHNTTGCVPRRIYAEQGENYGTSAILMKIAALLAVKTVSVYMLNIAGRPVIMAPTAQTQPRAILGAALTIVATMQASVEVRPWETPVSPIIRARQVFVSIMYAQQVHHSAREPSARE